MSVIRCLICGSSKWDPKGIKCGRCGAANGLRAEECYVTEETKKKLLDHAAELSRFGIQLKQTKSLRKSADTAITVAALVIACADSLHHGVLRELVHYLRDELLLPEKEILALRLDEPEKILTYYRMDKKSDD